MSGRTSFVETIIKVVFTTVASTLILIAFRSCYEFVLNPSGNHSVELRSSVARITGITCDNEPAVWFLWLKKGEYKYISKDRSGTATFIVFQSNDQRDINVKSVNVDVGSELQIPCFGTTINVANLWSVDSSGPKHAELRVHPGFEIQEDVEMGPPE